jgi:hypothetical protein
VREDNLLVLRGVIGDLFQPSQQKQDPTTEEEGDDVGEEAETRSPAQTKDQKRLPKSSRRLLHPIPPLVGEGTFVGVGIHPQAILMLRNELALLLPGLGDPFADISLLFVVRLEPRN